MSRLLRHRVRDFRFPQAATGSTLPPQNLREPGRSGSLRPHPPGVTPAQIEIDHILQRQGGLISRRRHPELTGSIEALLARKHLIRLLPGVYAAPAAAELPLTRVRAAALWDPDAVLTHQAAAWLTFWPTLRLAQVDLAVRHRVSHRAGFVSVRRIVPPDLLVERHGLRCTAPASDRPGPGRPSRGRADRRPAAKPAGHPVASSRSTGHIGRPARQPPSTAARPRVAG